MKFITNRFTKKFLPVVLIALPFFLHSKEFTDLEKHTQDFILETKQIIIPGFPGAFNASIIRWQGSLLLCFRVRNEQMISTFQMGLVWLDNNFNPISKPLILEIQGKNSSTFVQHQDPRLITLNKKLYIMYSNFIEIEGIVTRRMFIAQVHSAKEKFFIKDPLCLHPFDGWSKRWEKNWVPFVHEGNLLVSYSLLPHRVLRPSLELGECQNQSLTYSLIHWQWGELRGGTPALLDGKQYLAFFHSSIPMSTLHSEGKTMAHYFMGAYTFSAEPPFEITQISPEPIVGKNFYSAPTYNTWKPLRVVFPTGCLLDEKYVWITYGRQDFEIWVAKIDKKGLYKSLIPSPMAGNKFKFKRCVYHAEIEMDYLSENFIEVCS